MIVWTERPCLLEFLSSRPQGIRTSLFAGKTLLGPRPVSSRPSGSGRLVAAEVLPGEETVRGDQFFRRPGTDSSLTTRSPDEW